MCKIITVSNNMMVGYYEAPTFIVWLHVVVLCTIEKWVYYEVKVLVSGERRVKGVR